MDNTDGVRLDRWLWSARFFKTRLMAADAVRSGRVLLNNKRTKPAKSVRIGDQVRIRKAAFRYAIQVTALSETRVGADIAVTLYDESEQSVEVRDTLRTQLKLQRSGSHLPKGRPSKRERRQLNRLRIPQS
jgi:ribosome-associated heat shock protein Hsp15|tara:strand:+ start:449 stop:841 length:393 start_codon:yes stop_codon:yes gene_type:complete